MMDRWKNLESFYLFHETTVLWIFVSKPSHPLANHSSNSAFKQASNCRLKFVGSRFFNSANLLFF